MGTPLKIKILKSDFLHARKDQMIDPEPKFYVPRSSNGKDYGGQPKRCRIFNTGLYGDPPPLKIKILKRGFLPAREDQKIGLGPKFHVPGTFGGFGKRGQISIRYPADI